MATLLKQILTQVHGRRLGMTNKDSNGFGRVIVDDQVLQEAHKQLVAGGSATTLTADDAGKIIKLDTAAGTTITLPAATGSGAVFEFVVTVIATSNSHVIKVANATDTMQGIAFVVDTDTTDNAEGFAAGATADTITLNRSTTGSVTIGEKIVITDIASGKFQVDARLTGTGDLATPFSATVP